MNTFIVAAAALLVATLLMAQERGGPDARGYVMGLGGFSVSTGSSTGNSLLEGGIRIAPHVMVFGNLGRFGNLQSDLQPTLAPTTASLATNSA